MVKLFFVEYNWEFRTADGGLMDHGSSIKGYEHAVDALKAARKAAARYDGLLSGKCLSMKIVYGHKVKTLI